MKATTTLAILLGLQLESAQSFGSTFAKASRSSTFVLRSLERDFDSLTVAQLKDELKSRGLKIGGNKKELVERLESHEATIAVTSAVHTGEELTVPSPIIAPTEFLTRHATFRDLGILPQIVTSIESQEWDEPTPIQKLAVPEILKAFQDDGDETFTSLWAEAPTGSGKTGAFVIPLIQLTLENRRKDRNEKATSNRLMEKGDTLSVQVNLGRGRRFLKENSPQLPSKGFVSSLVLCPTRELAVQIGGVIEELVEGMPDHGRKQKERENIDVLVITGGVPMEPQIQMLAERKRSNRDVDILVATPGRLADVLSRCDKEDTVEKELETKLLQALELAGGKKDVSLSLARLEELDINKSLDIRDDGGRAAIQDMLSNVKYLVLDEADRLLSQGFKAEMDEILNLLPSAAKRATTKSPLRTLLFSATFPKQIQPRVEQVLQRLHGKDSPPPFRLSCSTAGLLTEQLVEEDSASNNRKQKRSKTVVTQPQIIFEGPASTIDLRTIRMEEKDRTRALRFLMEQYGENVWDRVLVFVGTRYASEHVARKLRRYNIKASELHGKLDQDARVRRLEEFKKGKTRVLIATDLASRGLDVQGLPAVVNYDLPRSTADFTHRVGRTGRAGNRGTAITFVTPTNEAHYDLIEKRHLGGTNAIQREILPGFEPDEAKWEVAKAATTVEVEGVQHSDAGLAHDRMFGGIKGRRKSKKDKIREKVAKQKVLKKED